MLRKYYSTLVDCFYDDHITTIGTLQRIIPIKEKFFKEIISMSDRKKANRRMLNALFVIIQSDDQMLNFCSAVLDLCSRDKFCNELVEFTRGKFII